MRVKKLELFGFKSFAHNTTVHFERGVTAIVGPNGSGKSNLVDCIRWVLGEHNPREVRAPRLEDVIFNGTDRRAPLSVAEGHLTIDNEQGLLPIAFTEVTISRRVYRSGESECFINQSPCRLKDIQELLLGTGLGGGTYAIIEQGHIDLILSSKPEERRIVFEEASGVAKYLAKRQETLRRLEEVEAHLVRIADVIGEVRRQISALERAANRARQYQVQWEQLKQLELRLAVDELRAGEARRQELEDEVTAMSARRDELERQKQAHVASLETCNASISATQRAFQELRTTVVECVSQIDQHEGQWTLKTRWVQELARQIEQLQAEEAEVGARTAQTDEQLARLGGGEAELGAQLAEAQRQAVQSTAELAAIESSLDQAASGVDAAKACLFEAASEASHRRNRLTEAASRLQALEAQLGRLQEQQRQGQADGQQAQRLSEEAIRGRDALQAQSEQIQQQIGSTQRALDAAGARRHELTGRLHQLRERLASERAEVRLLEDLWRRYEGFPETVRVLLGHGVEGLIGPLVDLVEARPGYEAVVEAALGPLSEALVVRDRQALARCRDVLQAQQLEGCRFLVLADCPGDPVATELPVLQTGVCGLVRQYLHTEPAYQPLVDWLLNDSWMVDDMQQFLGDGSAPLPQSRLVSVSGDRWDRRSWRFSGSRSPRHGLASAPTASLGFAARAGVDKLIGRKQRWEQAATDLQHLEEEVLQLEEASRQAEQAWQSLIGEVESAKGQLARVSQSLHDLGFRITQLTHDATRLERELGARERESRELAAQRDQLRATLTMAQREAEAAEGGQQAAEHSFAQAQAAREDVQQRRQGLLIAKAQVEAASQALAERLEALQVRTGEMVAERDRLVRELGVKRAQREASASRSHDLAQQADTHRQDSQRLQATRGQLEAEAGRVEESVRGEEMKRDQVLPHLLAVEQQLSALMRQIQDRAQQLSERTFRRSRLTERLKELYQVDEAMIDALRQAEATALTEEQRTATADHIRTLRSKLEGLGPVSLGSVEEHDALKRRMEFLQGQQQDLVQARDDLKASISQINRAARAQFRETFERIRQEFQHYYTRLFNGGQADLVLMDEDDVLESGIDIVARPPGKRLQSISLLSGGERALTAVALLFALFKVRPSPFCILDEIDAPLDEANVDRFTHVLEEFLSLSQFILITHNKKTITKADSLYGVTMEEPGVSKILSAKLSQPEQPASSAAPIGSAV